jgi:hypothetical protein
LVDGAPVREPLLRKTRYDEKGWWGERAALKGRRVCEGTGTLKVKRVCRGKGDVVKGEREARDQP